MKSSKYSNKNFFSISKTQLRGLFSSKKIFRIIVLVMFAGSIVYIVKVAGALSTTITREEKVIDKIVRLQVVDGSGKESLLETVLQKLTDSTGFEYLVDIADTVKFGLKDIESSFVVSRSENIGNAELIADRMRLDVSDIVYKPLEMNRNMITVSLFLGKDFETSRIEGLNPLGDE